MILIECDESGLDGVVERISSTTNDNGIVILMGELGSGKTTLVKAYAKRLGICESVTSPTFSVLQSYGDKMHHYDIYNKNLESFLSLGLLEILMEPGIHFVEWGDERLLGILNSIGIEPLVIKISPNGDKREYKIYA